jgi:alanine racemase
MQAAAVVKANAYGHGLAEVVPVIEPLVDALQVDDLDELRELRRLTGKRALVFGYVPANDVEEALALGCELTVFDLESVDAAGCAASRLGLNAHVHLKIDALLGRLGALPDQVEAVVEALKERPQLAVLTAYGHYANIEDTLDPSHSLRQEDVFAACFRSVKEAFPAAGRHLSATSGVMAREGRCAANDMVRLGIGVYGLYPSDALAVSHANLGLRPALRWVSRLAQVKTLPAGHPVSYGLTYVTERPTVIGVVPQGYSDGFDRGLTNRGEVLVGGYRCPVVGRVAMNMFMVDLSAVPGAKAGDEVVLLGEQGTEVVSAEKMAAAIDTINYEVVARLSPLLPRRLVE